MRLWRNRQTRTFEGRVGDRMGSSPISRTNKKDFLKESPFLAKLKHCDNAIKKGTVYS